MGFMGGIPGSEWWQGVDGGRPFGCPASHPLGHPLISAAAVVDTVGELPLLTAPPIEARGVRHSHVYSSTFFKATEVCLACMAQCSPEVWDLMAPGQPSTMKGGSHGLDVPPHRFTCPGQGPKAPPYIFWLHNSGSHSVCLSGDFQWK